MGTGVVIFAVEFDSLFLSLVWRVRREWCLVGSGLFRGLDSRELELGRIGEGELRV
jgi:hypothetical protein